MFVLIILVFSAIIMGIVLFISDSINTGVQNTADFPSDFKAQSDDINNRLPKLFDGFFMVMFALLFIFMIVSVFLIDAHPVFLG